MTSPAVSMTSPAVSMTSSAVSMTSPACSITSPALSMTSPACSMTSPAVSMTSPAVSMTSPALPCPQEELKQFHADLSSVLSARCSQAVNLNMDVRLMEGQARRVAENMVQVRRQGRRLT